MMINEEQFQQFLSLKKTVEERALDVAREKHIIETGEAPVYEWIESISFEEPMTCEITAVQYSCGCCSDEHAYFEFPYSYLFDNDWKETLKKQIQAEKEAKEREEQQKKAEQEKKKQEERRAAYEALKKEFE